MKLHTLKTPRHALFALRYLQTYNATSSYLEYYDCSYDTARSAASRLLARKDVRQFIDSIILSGIELNKLKSEAMLGKALERVDEIISGDIYVSPTVQLAAANMVVNAHLGNGYGTTLTSHLDRVEAAKRAQMKSDYGNFVDSEDSVNLEDSANEVYEESEVDLDD